MSISTNSLPHMYIFKRSGVRAMASITISSRSSVCSTTSTKRKPFQASRVPIVAKMSRKEI